MALNLADIKPEEPITMEELLRRLVEQIKETTDVPVLYDLGCGKNPCPGFVGVDLYSGADVVADLVGGEWDFCADESVDFFYSSHFVEHVEDFRGLFAKVYRKLKPGGYAVITTPYGASNRAWMDPDHKRPIFRETYFYLNADWRERNGIHYGPDVNFEIIEQFPVWNARFQFLAPEQQAYHLEHTWNAVDDLTVILRKPKA